MTADLDVVVATHDRPRLVRAAIDGVLGQDWEGTIRCLVVHDRTEPDASLGRAATRRTVEVLRNTRTPGLAGARNTGVLAGAAPLVAFCDDDDVWRPDKVRRQVQRLRESGADTVVSGIVVAHAGGTTRRVPRSDELTVARLVRRRVMAAHPSTVLVRREALLGAIGLVDEEIPGSFAEDYDWILRAAAAGEVAVVEDALVDVRWGGSQFARDWPVIIAALEHLVDRHPAFSADRRALARVRGQQAFAMAAVRRPGALAAAARAARSWPLEPRAVLAAAVALRLTSAERLLAAANRHGRGI